jgi:hypothetical protein
MSRKKFERFVKWCGPGGGSFGYEKEDEDRDGILWAAERIALLEKVVDAAREIDGCEFAERCETWMLDDLEAALRALDGGGE